MQPASSAAFLRVAVHRLEAAEKLYEWEYNLDARYLAGYTIECSLKALILKWTPQGERRVAMLAAISSGKRMHDPETLFDVLRRLRFNFPSALAKRIIRADWSSSLRYETGFREGGGSAARATLEAAREVLSFAKGACG